MPRGGAQNKLNKTLCSEAEVIAAVRKRKGKLYLAAQDLKVTMTTLRAYKERWPKVQEAIWEEKGRMLDFTEDKLYQAIREGAPWAICFFLKCQGKGRNYLERSEVRHGGDTKAPPIEVNITGLSDAELDRQISVIEEEERAEAAAQAGAEDPPAEGPGDGQLL